MNLIINMIARAILRGDEFFKGIKLPSPQGAGTDTQKISYSRYKAREIYAQNASLFQ